ncbi:hypothetical protein, partial [Klebsiella pneumoniae]|uniref:hypothetical protein n=1 Tax=Klebsiella pneumoniae TaxID=573 RepID=UPI001F4B93E2
PDSRLAFSPALFLPSYLSFLERRYQGFSETSPKSLCLWTRLTAKNPHPPRKIKILQITYLQQWVNEK